MNQLSPVLLEKGQQNSEHLPLTFGLYKFLAPPSEI